MNDFKVKVSELKRITATLPAHAVGWERNVRKVSEKWTLVEAKADIVDGKIAEIADKHDGYNQVHPAGLAAFYEVVAKHTEPLPPEAFADAADEQVEEI